MLTGGGGDYIFFVFSLLIDTDCNKHLYDWVIVSADHVVSNMTIVSNMHHTSLSAGTGFYRCWHFMFPGGGGYIGPFTTTDISRAADKRYISL